MQQQQVITTTTANQLAVQTEQSHDSRVYHKYSNQTSLVLGALQVVIGLLCIFFNLAAVLLGATHGRVSHGFWCGSVFIVGGIFGIKAAGLKTGCLITSFMVFSIINAILCVFLLSIAADGIQKDKSCRWGVCFSAYSSASNKETREGQVAVNGFLVGLALAEIIFSIWSSAICCAAVCCGNSPPSPGVIRFVNVPNQMQATFITPGTQALIPPGVQMWIQPTVSTGAPQMIPVAQPAPYAPPPPPYTTINQGYYAPPAAAMSSGTQQTTPAPQIPPKTTV